MDEYAREAAFTFLNRFVALKMLEARELVQQCVSKGDQSSGFKEFTGLAPGMSELPDDGYRLYLEYLFDELSIEVKVFFDRRDPASLLWPRRQARTDLLDILNQPELAGVWDQDETIGWVYQYFNSSEERKKIRDESQAPRNSRELAVRNQFFTPRYVVEFLTDNTLGRIWYLRAHKVEFGLGREVDTSDFHVEVIDLLNNKVEAELGVGFFVAAFSALRRTPVMAATLVIGDMSIQGNIKRARSLTEPLQIAMDNGARRALIPIENKRDFLEVSGDIVEHVDPVFYGGPKAAAFKSLGLT